MTNEVKKIKLSWQCIEDKVNCLYNKIKDNMPIDKFDAVISIGRGGMIPARLLAEKFDIHTAYVVDAKAYTDDNKLGEMKISDLKLSDNINSVLVVDDVIFTGTTLDAVIENLKKNNPHMMYNTNAFLYKNLKTAYNDCNYCYAEEYDGDSYWLVFPWEND